MKNWIAVWILCAGIGWSEPTEQPKITFREGLETADITRKQERYSLSLGNLEKDRVRLATKWKNADRSERSAVLAKARTTILTAFLTDIFPAWFGTTWDFYGVTQTPGEGKIACGYFVTTCMRDAGFKLDRVKLAQQASQRIIRTVAEPKDVKLLYEKPVSELTEHFRKSGPGLYIVGLDQHTGFVVNDGEKLAFIHSSYYRPPFSVTAEPIEGSNPLAHSKYRMIGKILSDQMLTKWLSGTYFPMKR